MNIPEEWVKVGKLENLGRVFNGLTGKTKTDFGYGEPYIPYVNVFKNAKVDINELGYVRIRSGEKQNELKFGDIIFTTSSETIEEVGMTSVFLSNKEKIYLNSFCFIYRLSDLNWLIPEFAQFLFRSDNLRYGISLFGQGSTRYNLSKTRLLSELNFVIPKSPSEQYQVAIILSKVDEAINQTEKLIAKYGRIKTGLMQDLLTKGIDGQSCNTIKSELKNIQINSNFTETKLQTITKVRQGYQIAISERKKEEGSNRFIYITVQYLNNPKKYLEYIENPPEGVICNNNDILFTRTGNTGQIVTDITGVYHNNFFKVAFDNKRITKQYLILYLNWEPIQDLIKELAGTTTIPDMKHKDFYGMPIFFPKDLNEQIKISQIIGSSTNQLKTFEKHLSKLQSIKTGLMQDLLSGKVRVNHLIKEATSV
jgi:type I restriction enzyme S subunit